MSQFRETGVYYVSEWGGNAANPGTDVSPYSHPADYGTSGTVNVGIIGAGHYNGAWTGLRTLLGDGKVIIDGGGATLNTAQHFRKIHFKNFSNLFAANTSNNNAHDCIFENIPIMSFRGGSNIIYGEIWARLRNIYLGEITSNFRSKLVSDLIFANILGTGNTGIAGLEFCFLAKNNTVRLTNLSGEWTFLNSLVNGKIISNVNGLTYESKKMFDGSPRPDADPSILDIVDIYPNFYTNGCFSGDPKFIDVMSRTVDPSSDLLRKSNVSGFIGGVKPGQYINFANSNFVITFQNIDTSNPDLLRIATGFDFGKIRITGKVSDTLISSQAVDIRIPFFFDSSEPGGDPLNNNVPDAVHGLRGLDTLGDVPYRLRFEVRSSQMPNASRFNNDEWDNDISGIAGRWYLMEYGQPMLHHIVASVAYGNADKFAINAPVKVPFNYRSLDIEITLSNNRSQI